MRQIDELHLVHPFYLICAHVICPMEDSVNRIGGGVQPE